MKRTVGILALLLSLSLLAACTAQGRSYCPPAEEEPSEPAAGEETPVTADGITCVEPPVTKTFRIVDGAEEGSLLLADLDASGYGGVYTLNLCETAVWLDGEPADSTALEDGMAILVTWDGVVMETYPAQLGNISSIEAWSVGSEENPGGGYYDLCGLYLQVLNDLWEVDPALNESKSRIGLDLTLAPGGLTDSEKSALAWRFGELHGVEVSLTTFDQLKEEGALTGQVMDEDTTFYTWEDGCLFSITPHETEETEVYSLPVLRFDAEKYVGPLAAYIFYDCAAVWPEFGSWSEYTVGAEMIA